MLSIGLVGLANVGKSTLFKALTDVNALIANYPFATIEPNTGVVPVPDERLQKLAKIYKTEKIVPATITFVDIAGLIKGASKGEGLGNQFLAHIRGVNAICHVVRAFEDENVARSGSVNPKEDIEIVNTELVLADLQTVNNRLAKFQKEAKANPKLIAQLQQLEKIKFFLDSGRPLFENPELKNNDFWLKQLQLLTAKPVIYVFNLDEKSLQDSFLQKQMKELVKPAKALFVCAKLESELKGLDESDRKELLESAHQNESSLAQLIDAAYNILGLQSFLTAGQKEIRAWTIKKGTTALEAAGAIHSDFQRGFINAQVVNYHELIEAGSFSAAKSAGKVRTEGRDYVMQPDDVVEFRFNV
jgi:hypothetical protein